MENLNTNNSIYAAEKENYFYKNLAAKICYLAFDDYTDARYVLNNPRSSAASRKTAEETILDTKAFFNSERFIFWASTAFGFDVEPKSIIENLDKKVRQNNHSRCYDPDVAAL